MYKSNISTRKTIATVKVERKITSINQSNDNKQGEGEGEGEQLTL